MHWGYRRDLTEKEGEPKKGRDRYRIQAGVVDRKVRRNKETMKHRRKIIGLVLCLAMLLGVVSPGAAVVLNEPIPDTGVIKLLKAIRPLGTIATVMNTAAHPDDERSNMLAALALGEGVSTHLVTITRGQGGQNAIGPEIYNAMGVLRTEELNKSVKVLETTVDYARIEFDSPCMDFGFSKMWEETQEKWDFDYVTERFCYFIRKYRPEIVVIPFNLDRTTHGHHQAIIICTINGIEAAADPTRYPEQGLPAFQVKKMYEPANKDNVTTRINTGKYDPWYGETYQHISEYARGFHACQGMGGYTYQGPRELLLQLSPGAPTSMPEVKPETSIFEGVPYDFREYAELVEDAEIAALLGTIQDNYEAIYAAFPHNKEVLSGVWTMQENVEKAVALVAASSLGDDVKYDLNFHLEKKLTQLARAAAAAAAIDILVVPDDMEVVPGQTFNVAVRVYQGVDAPMAVESIELNLPEGFAIETGAVEGSLGENLTYIQNFTVTAPTAPANEDFYNAFHGDGIFATVSLKGEKAFTQVGTSDGNFAFVPEFSVAVEPQKVAVNTAKEIAPASFTIKVTNNGPEANQGTLSLALPEGFTAEPASKELSFAKGGEGASVTFEVMPPEGVAEGAYTFVAQMQGETLLSDQTVQAIDYQHIDKTYYIFKAEGTVQVFPVAFDENRKIGYIASGNDTVGETLQTLGMNVTFLTDDDVRYGDLNAYGTIITGVRAYRYRTVLAECYDRLLSYVEKGGNLIVQYHTSGDGYKPEYAPYPFKIGSPSLEWRVTYEDSPVTILVPDSPLLNAPNKIAEADWDGWVQERSLYVPMEWDPAYEAPIRSGLVEQEGREYDGQILTAPYGEGRFTYTSIVFFRQVPDLVPGGVRLFANLINQ